VEEVPALFQAHRPWIIHFGIWDNVLYGGQSFEQKIDYLPTGPGVYFFKDERGTILYVGKAGSIKHRVSSYFQKPEGKDAKTLALIERVADIETIVTDTEKRPLSLRITSSRNIVPVQCEAEG